MTPKRERFVQEYVVDFNGTQAAVRAGYSPKTANEQASRLLAKANIKAAVEREKARYCTHAGLTKERVLNEIRRIAFSNSSELFDENGALRDVRSLSPDMQAAVSSVKVLKTNLVSGDGAREALHEVKLWDKPKALEMAAKHLGLLDEKDKPWKGELVVSWKMPPSAAPEQAIDVTPRAISGTVKEGE